MGGKLERKYHELNIDGIKVYVPEYIESDAHLRATGIIISTNLQDVQEYLEKTIPPLIQKFSEKIKNAGFRYVVVMSLADYAFNKRKQFAIPVDTTYLLVFYKRKPKINIF